MGKTWAIASGSGGVGKTTLSLLLAIGTAKKGKQTIILDASGVSRSCDLLLGLESIMSIDLTDALSQQIDLQSALYEVPQCSNLRIANASFFGNASLSELSGLVLALQSMCDILVIDLPTGTLFTDRSVLTAQDEMIFVSRPDDASMRSTERLLQRIRDTEVRYSLILNRVKRDKIKKGTQYTGDSVMMILDCPILGSIPEDEGYMADLVTGKGLRIFAHWMSNPVHDILHQLLNC